MEAIDRTFEILELYLKHEESMSITELARLSGLSRTATHRIATALVKRGYLNQKEKRGKYSLGLRLLDYSRVIQRNLKIADVALPFLQELSKVANESVNLGIQDGTDMLVIAQIEVSHRLRVSGPVGRRVPLYSTAVGKLFLAQMSELERQAIFDGTTIEKFTKNTITDINKMGEEIELIKAQGCAFDREESDVGIWSVAAPVYGVTGKIEAGVSVIAPVVRINNRKIRTLTSRTKSCASELSQELGYTSLI